MANNTGGGQGSPLAHCEFEVSPFNSHLWGNIEATIYEEGGNQPTSIIGCDQPWYVLIKWCVFGHMVHHLCGEWCVCVYLESIGPSPEYRLPEPCIRIPMEPCAPSQDQAREVNNVRVYCGVAFDGTPFCCYELKVRVPPGGVQCDPCGSLYLVGVTLTSFDSCRRPGHIGAFCRDATVMLYDPANA